MSAQYIFPNPLGSTSLIAPPDGDLQESESHKPEAELPQIQPLSYNTSVDVSRHLQLLTSTSAPENPNQAVVDVPIRKRYCHHRLYIQRLITDNLAAVKIKKSVAEGA